MKFTYIIISFLILTISNLLAEETRQVDKHEHGVGELNVAIDKNIMNFEFMLPGADIVGFEYKAKSEEDINLVNNALTKFEDSENLLIIPEEGRCNLISLEIKINQEEEHEEHDEHDEEVHNEFYAKYSFECENIKNINKILFPYFSSFINSGELEIQFISELGSTSFEVEADRPFINTKGKI